MPADDPTTEVARQLALSLREAMGERSARAVSKLCGVHQTTICAILNGTAWPDLHTTVLLEDGLGVDLWPRRYSAGIGASQQ